MRFKRVILWMAGALIVFISLVYVYSALILDWNGRPYCHKQLNSAFSLWMGDRNTNSFPNVAGNGRESLAEIHELVGDMDWATNYNYVAGLQKDDPGQLILLYVNRPTRWTWHGPAPNIFKERAWIVVPVDFKLGGRPSSGQGELSERVSPEEFKRRLIETLDFIRTNARPNWQTVVAEHMKFLKSIEQAK